MERRSMLKRLGALGAVGTGAGLGTTALSGTARGAEVSGTFDLNNAGPVTTDTGDVEYVQVDANFDVSWDGFDQAADRVRFVDTITVRPNNEDQSERIFDGTSDPFAQWSGNGDSNGWGGAGEYVVSDNGTNGRFIVDINWNVIGDPSASSAADGGSRSVETPADLLGVIEPDADGTTRESVVQYQKLFRFLNADGQPLTGPGSVMDGSPDDLVLTETFTVTITNQEAAATGDGDGSTGIGT